MPVRPRSRPLLESRRRTLFHERVSSSQIHLSLKRLQRSRLVDNQDCRPRLRPIEEFLVHGLKYAFPARRGEPNRGMPTAHAASPLQNQVAANSELPPV